MTLLIPRHSRYDYVPPTRAQGLQLAGRQAARVLHDYQTLRSCVRQGAAVTTTPSSESRQTHRNYSWRDYGNASASGGCSPRRGVADATRSQTPHSLLYKPTRRRSWTAPQARRRDSSGTAAPIGEPPRFRWEDDEARVIKEVTDAFANTRGPAAQGLDGGRRL